MKTRLGGGEEEDVVVADKARRKHTMMVEISKPSTKAIDSSRF